MTGRAYVPPEPVISHFWLARHWYRNASDGVDPRAFLVHSDLRFVVAARLATYEADVARIKREWPEQYSAAIDVIGQRRDQDGTFAGPTVFGIPVVFTPSAPTGHITATGQALCP